MSGLHLLLGEDSDLAACAARHEVALIDLRRPPARLRLPREVGAVPRTAPFVVLTVGSDCNVGKMTAGLEVVRAAREAGIAAAFGATGQTGILIAGGGIAIDRVIADFIAGATEQVIDDCGPVEWVVVEGGVAPPPGLLGVTLGLCMAPARMR
jgi:uncharacterized NAD-dependent epimerase/dehydratase family protein